MLGVPHPTNDPSLVSYHRPELVRQLPATLPILIETVPPQSTPLFDIESAARALVGQAHLVRFEGDAARTAFHGLYRDEILLARGLALVWPGRDHRAWGGGGLTQNGARQELRSCIGLLNVAANGSLAPLRAPRYRRRADDAPVRVASPETSRQVICTVLTCR